MTRIAIAGLLGFLALGCAARPVKLPDGSIVVSNPTKEDWKEAPVYTDSHDLLQEIGKDSFVGAGNISLPVQMIDLDGDGSADEAFFLPSLRPGDSIALRPGEGGAPSEPARRAHTGMYLKGFEGPGWESDVLAFRIYWDARNATDIFCKRRPVLGLAEYANPEVNYHQDTPWGMDVLKVGTALGIGGFGTWQDGKVVKVTEASRDFKVLADGPLCAVADLIYTDWKAGDRTLDLTARVRMAAGQHFCDVDLWVVPKDNGPMPELVIGFVKHPETELITDAREGILGRFGKQALGPGESVHSALLGLGVIYDPADAIATGEDDVNTFVRLRPRKVDPPPGLHGNGGWVHYRVNASWEHEPEGAHSTRDYTKILRHVARLRPQLQVP